MCDVTSFQNRNVRFSREKNTVNQGSVGRAESSSVAATDLQWLSFRYFGVLKILECFPVLIVLILQSWNDSL